jgi:hypothetical protein
LRCFAVLCGAPACALQCVAVLCCAVRCLFVLCVALQPTHFGITMPGRAVTVPFRSASMCVAVQCFPVRCFAPGRCFASPNIGITVPLSPIAFLCVPVPMHGCFALLCCAVPWLIALHVLNRGKLVSNRYVDRSTCVVCSRSLFKNKSK